MSGEKKLIKQIFDDLDIYLSKVDKRIMGLIVSHGINLSDIKPSYQEIKKKYLGKNG